jgi:hypothetical protein
MKEEGNEAIEYLLYEMRQEIMQLSANKHRIPEVGNIGNIEKDISERLSQLFIIDLKVIEKSNNPKVLIERIKKVSKQNGKFVVVISSRSREQL